MSLINQEGTFRGTIVDKAVSISTNGFPQVKLILNALEYYDAELENWMDWSEVPESEITAYLILFDGKNNKTLSCQQVEKVLGWGCTSFAELEALDIEEVKIQFRVVSRTYQEKTSLQVEWIDEYDATPGRTARRLDATELKDLDAAYAMLMNKPKVKPASAKAPKAPADKKTVTQTASQATDTRSAPIAPPKVSPKTVATAPPTTDRKPVKKSTKQDAWDSVVDMKSKKVTDEKLAQTWVDTIEKVVPGKADADITPEEWGQIEQIVLDECAVF